MSRRNDAYREAARKLIAEVPGATVDEHATVAHVPYPNEGAFVEVHIKVPASAVQSPAEPPREES